MLPSSGSAFDVRQFANPDRHDPDLAETPLRGGATTEGAPQVAGRWQTAPQSRHES